MLDDFCVLFFLFLLLHVRMQRCVACFSPSFPFLIAYQIDLCIFLVATAGRMDAYVDQFMEAGGSYITLAKGNRSKQVTNACKKHGGFYLGSIGGPAAILAQNCIKSVSVLDHEEDGMEAVWKIDVENFPAFIVVDDKGEDFFKEWLG
jgi:tartrate/fumarate subfamily iron-sulfur-dependent hydro-lyase beta chain